MFGSGTTTLLISNEEMNYSIKIVKSLDKSCEQNNSKWSKITKCRFLSMLLGTLVASLLENLLTSKGTKQSGEDTIRAGQDF